MKKRFIFVALIILALSVSSCRTNSDNPTSALSPSPSTAISASTTDAVENYILMAAKTRDGFHTVNATIFRPDDPRLKYEHEKRSGPAPSSQEVFAKLEPIASFNDPSAGPQPTDETDQVEARMLMDETLVGTGYWKDSQTSTGEMLLVFLDPCSSTMPQIREKYGSPTKTIESGRSHLHFYGRMIFVEVGDGKIHSVLRRAIKGTQKSANATPQAQENANATFSEFNEDDLTIGQRYTWQGTVKGKYHVLVATQVLVTAEGSSGDTIEYVAELRSITLPPKGTKVTFDGVLQDKSMTGTDFHYRPDGSRTTTATKYLVLKKCHVH